MSEWWHWLLLTVICVAAVAYVWLIYRKDGRDLCGGTKWSLVMLRLLALGGILFFFMDLEKRTENREIKTSRAVVLVDTSQSMGLQDTNASTGDVGQSRIEQVTVELQQGSFLRELRRQHDVAVYRFDQQTSPQEVGFFGRALADSDQATQNNEDARRESTQDALEQARYWGGLGGTLVIVATIGLLLFLVLQRLSSHRELVSWLLFVSLVLLTAGLGSLAISHLSVPHLAWKQISGLSPVDQSQTDEEGTERETSGADSESEDTPREEDPRDIAWPEQLAPRGTETRIGDAIQTLVERERGGPIAGLVLFTDGRNNAGVDGLTAAAAAQSAGIPVYTVGLGSDRQPVNVRLVDLEAPKRVFPGDKFEVTGYVQAYGLEGRSVSLELGSNESDGQELEDDLKVTLEDERTVRLPADGQVLPVRFEVTPNEIGSYVYQLRVLPPEQDVEQRDNKKIARVKVVDRKTRVLLLAGGPTREFRFLRNQLYRDRDTTVDVLLQSSSVGISQEADQVLDEFPVLPDDLFQYDCIIAFDPDWLQLDIEQLRTLDRWIAEQAGGLITVAGPIYTPSWAGLRRGRDARADAVRAIYPVVFYGQGSANLSLGRFGGESAWPLDFTSDGLNAEFFRLEDDALDSEAAWNEFEGIYGYYSVKDPKPGARVYARFSNPDTSIDGDLPIYAAGHLFGAGRVYFQASGEMWRLRAVDVSYFETYYTKLIRWVSQGRLMRDSSRGVLLVEKDRCLLGEQVTVRAVLNDSQHKPLIREQVTGILVTPSGERRTITLRKVKNAAREGIFETQFAASEQGEYRLEMAPPDGPSDELLTAEVRVRVPTLESENPQRNDALLKDIAERTGGEYYIGTAAAMNRGTTARASLASALEPNDQIIYLPATMDSAFDERLMGWLMVLISGLLATEWLIRRLSKLA